MRNPTGAARKVIRENSDALIKCYSAHYVYLVDEMSMSPSCKTVQNDEKMVYPMRVDMNPTTFKNVFLPFMNITVMKALAIGKLDGLVRLVGLPPSDNLPTSWKGSEQSLLHSLQNTSSVEEFVSLQAILRKNISSPSQGDASSARSGSISSSYVGSLISNSLSNFSISGSVAMELSANEAENLKVPLGQLEVFFKEHDPMRAFGKLKRAACGHEESATGIWTSEDQIVRLKVAVEKEAKLEFDKKKKVDEELKAFLCEWKEASDKKTDVKFQALASEWLAMKNGVEKSVNKNSDNVKASDKRSDNARITLHNHAKYQFTQCGETALTESEYSKMENIREEYDEETKLGAVVGDNGDSKVSYAETTQTHLIGHTNPKALAKKKDSDDERTSKPRRRRFRPWFGIC